MNNQAGPNTASAAALRQALALNTAAPGVNIAGIAGPGWSSADCGLYRGFEAIPPQLTGKTGNYCDPMNPRASCDPENPNGGWATPLEQLVEAGDVANVQLFTTVGAVVKALSIVAILDDATGVILTPDLVTIGQFSSGRTRQMFPGWGGQTKATNGAGTTIGNLSAQLPENIMRPVTDFTEQTLLDGQNNLPPAMARVNLGSSNNGFQFQLANGKGVDIRVLVKLYLSYNADIEAK